MEIKRTTEIFIEATRRFVVRQASANDQFICPECGSPMFAAEQAAEILRVSRRRIYQTIEAGARHFVETETGAVMICLPPVETILRVETDAANGAENSKGI